MLGAFASSDLAGYRRTIMSFVHFFARWHHPHGSELRRYIPYIEQVGVSENILHRQSSRLIKSRVSCATCTDHTNLARLRPFVLLFFRLCQ